MQYSVIIPCNQCGSNFYCYFEEGTPVPSTGVCDKCDKFVLPKPKPIETINEGDAIYIMASGPSINDITEGQWRYLKTQKTLGISHFYKKNWEPTYYFSLEQLDSHSQMKMIMDHYFKNEWKTKLFFNAAARKWVGDNVDVTWVNIGDWLNSWDGGIWTIDSENPPSTFEKAWAKKIDDPLFSFRGTLSGAINLATVIGAGRIVLVGVDMNDESHFYKDVPYSKHLKKIKNEFGFDDKLDGHSTNCVYSRVRGICDALKIISKHIKITCASKDSYLVKNGIFKYEEIQCKDEDRRYCL